MNVLVVVPYLSNGGAEKAMFNLALFFYKKEIKVTIVAAATIETTNKKYLPAEVRFFTMDNNLPLTRPAFFSNTKKMLPIIKEIKPDIVLCTSDYLSTAVLLAKKISKFKFKVVISIQLHMGTYIKDLPFLNRLFIRLLHKFISMNADTLVGASVGVSENYAKMNNLTYPSSKMAAIYNPIFDEAIIQNSLIDPADNNFKRTSINIITVGRLVKQKDQETLIKAFAQVVLTNPDAILFIIGIGEEEKKLRELSVKLKIEQQIVFLGYQVNPFSFVSRCQLFVLSSAYEGFGNVIVEALAVGTNVVSTDCPSGPAEILNYGEFGYLCEPENAELLTQAMLKSLREPIAEIKLRQRAEQFSIEISGTQFIELFQRLKNSRK